MNSDCSVPHVSSVVHKFIFHFHLSVFEPQRLVAIVNIWDNEFEGLKHKDKLNPNSKDYVILQYKLLSFCC